MFSTSNRDIKKSILMKKKQNNYIQKRIPQI